MNSTITKLISFPIKLVLILSISMLCCHAKNLENHKTGNKRLKEIFSGTKSNKPLANSQLSKEETEFPVDTKIPEKEIVASPTEEANIVLNFENTALSGIVTYLCGQKKINIIPHKDLDAVKVSLRTKKPFSIEQAWNIMLTLLEMHGFSIIEVGGVHRLVQNKENGREPIPIYSSANGIEPEDLPNSDQVIRYIYFLKNIKADVGLSILGKMLNTPPQIHPDLEVLVIKEKSLSIKSAMKIIKELDSNGLRQSIKILPLEHTDPNIIADLFEKDIKSGNHEQERVRFVSSSKKPANFFSSTTRIIPDPERGILILLGQEKDLEKVVSFIKEYLDKPMEDAKSRIHIREVYYHDADKLSRLLNKITHPPQGASPQALKAFEGVVIVPETPGGRGNDSTPSGNRLIIACDRDDWIRLSALIDKIDKPQPQVAFEVMIVNLTIDMTRKLGAQIRDTGIGVFGEDAAFRLANLTEVNLRLNSAGGLIEGSSADDEKATSINGTRESSMHAELSTAEADESIATLGKTTDGVKSTAWGILKAIIRKDNSSIISQPFLIANNNEKCELISTEEKRVDGEFIKSLQSIQAIRKREYFPASTRVSLTPRVNSAGVIDIGIDISVEDFKEVTSGQPETNTRALSTRASMGVGEVLVLGGIAGSTLVEEHSQTPGLGSIPIIGNFFKSKKKVMEKKHLYIFVRPSVIKPQINGQPDDYTQFKIDYAKHQVFKTETYSKSKDPIQRFFFKPRNHTIQETVDAVRNQRFGHIDNFMEREYIPPSANMQADPYYRTSETLEKQKTTRKHSARSSHKYLKSRKSSQA